MQEEKTALRRRIIQRLKLAAAADSEGRRSAALRSLLSPYLETDQTLNIALYAPLPHEVNLLPLMEQYPQHRYAFPRCLPEHRLSFHHVSDPEQDLHPGAMGIPTPAAHLTVISPEQFDIVIVPGVSFTHEGARLGYGGGYYDRFLPSCSKAQILALAFAEQMESHLPLDSFDFMIPLVLHL